MKDNFIKDLELNLSLSGMDKDNIEKAIRCAIGALENYDMSERVTAVTVRFEEMNERILKRYVACLRLDGKSEKTIRQYLYVINGFSQGCRKPFTEVTTNEIRFYLSIKSEGKKKSYIKTLRYYLSAFFKWMKEEELIVKSPVDRINDIKCEEEVRLPFSSVDIDRMRTAITGRNAIRDRAIIEVLLSSGVRCAELCGLNIGDIDLESKTIIIRKGKGGKGRKAFVSDVAAEYVCRYLETREDDEIVLFRTKNSAAFTVSGIENMLRKYGKIAGVENVHPHRFRRTFATSMYRRGMDIEEIRRLMGHTNVQTTLRYIYTDDAHLKASYNKYAA